MLRVGGGLARLGTIGRTWSPIYATSWTSTVTERYYDFAGYDAPLPKGVCRFADLATFNKDEMSSRLASGWLVASVERTDKSTASLVA